MRLAFWKRRPDIVPTALEQRDLWIDWLRLSGARDATIDGYRRTTTKFLERHPDLAFADITDEHLLGYIEEANPASRQQRRGAFANWFGWAYRTKRIAKNPMHHVPTYKQGPQPRIDVFTEVEQKLMCALPEPDGTLMALLLGSGMRRSEATNLTVRRVDLEHAELHIVEGAKGGYSRIVPIDHQLVQRLAGYFLTEGLNPDDHLWYCHPGGQTWRSHNRVLTSGSWHMWWKRCLAAAGVTYRKPHTTRHTYATEWRRRGLVLDDVGVLLGHADLKTTKRVYDHTNYLDVRRRMEALQ